MKKLTSLLLLLTSCSSPNLSTIGTLSNPTGLTESTRKEILAFNREISKPGSHSDLFILCESWAASYFLDPASVITYRNPNAGILIGKYESSNELHYINTFTIKTKANQIKITISNPVNKEGKNAITKDLSEARAKLILQDWQQVSGSLTAFINQN